MNTNSIFNRFCQSPRMRTVCLASVWGMGLLLGMFLYCRLFQGNASIPNLHLLLGGRRLGVLSVGLPIALVAICVYFNHFVFCYPIFFIVALTRGFCALLIFSLVGYGAWILRGLLMFSGVCSSVIMWWLLLRLQQPTALGMLRTVVISTGIICITDYFVITPFLNGLSTNF